MMVSLCVFSLSFFWKLLFRSVWTFFSCWKIWKTFLFTSNMENTCQSTRRSIFHFSLNTAQNVKWISPCREWGLSEQRIGVIFNCYALSLIVLSFFSDYKRSIFWMKRNKKNKRKHTEKRSPTYLPSSYCSVSTLSDNFFHVSYTGFLSTLENTPNTYSHCYLLFSKYHPSTISIDLHQHF